MSQPPTPWNSDEFAERIVREVIRRLLAMGIAAGGDPAARGSATANTAARPHRIEQRLITTATLESVPAGTTELLVPHRAVVTPLARDEAKAQGMRITRVEATSVPEDHLKR